MAKLTKEALADGKVLRYLVDRFYEKRQEDRLEAVLTCLRDSEVWVPLTSPVPKGEDPLNRWDILSHTDGARFFVAFSQMEAVPEEYAGDRVWERKHFMDCVSRFRKTDTVEGIVLDPFSRSMILDSDLIGYVFTLPSQLGKQDED